MAAKKKVAKKKASRKSNAGRPKGSGSKYNTERAALICARIADGKSARSACTEAGIDLVTHYRWQREHPEYAQQVSRAKDDQADTFVDDMILMADSEEDVARAKLKIDARKWVASKFKPKAYGDKLQVDQTTRIEDHSAEEIKEALQQKLKALQAQGIDVGALIK